MSLDFGAPKTGENIDQSKSRKLAQRVEQVLNERVKFKDPKQLDPRSILVSPLNRDGAPPNIQHIHADILKGFLVKGFDRTRPQVGICVEYLSEKGKQRLLEHNYRFSKGQNLLPPIDDSKALYGSLAGSHLNLALRIIQGGGRSPAGDLGSLFVNNESLKDVVQNGHRWWILPEDIDESLLVDISLWRNQDQNENQGTNEIEMLQGIMQTANLMCQTCKKILLSDLVAKPMKRNPAKMSNRAMGSLAKFYTMFLNTGDQSLVSELIDWHSANINPKDLVVNNAFFETLISEEAFSSAPHLRVHLLQTQYTDEKVTGTSGGPSTSKFIEPSVMMQLAKKPDLVQQVEGHLKDLRAKYLPLLEKTLSPTQSRLELAVYSDLVIRALLSKPWPIKPDSLKIKLVVWVI